MRMSLQKLLGIASVVIALQACTSTQVFVPPDYEPPVDPDPVPAYDPSKEVPQAQSLPVPEEPKIEVRPVYEVPPLPSIVVSMLDEAKRQHAEGNSRAATASAERAIRLAPRHPEPYYVLASIEEDLGSTRRANALANKSLSLGAEGSLRRKVKKLIAATQ